MKKLPSYRGYSSQELELVGGIIRVLRGTNLCVQGKPWPCSHRRVAGWLRPKRTTGKRAPYTESVLLLLSRTPGKASRLKRRARPATVPAAAPSKFAYVLTSILVDDLHYRPVRIFYCTRTFAQLSQVVDEYGRLPFSRTGVLR